MARYVFFSFSYDDVKNFKVNVVRNSWLLHHKSETFIDGSIWEKSKTNGDVFLKKLINDGLKNTSVTAVLIGADTANRRWVNYEIISSFEKGNGIFGIHINRIKGTTGITSRGLNPLDRLGMEVSNDGLKIQFYEIVNSKWKPFEDLPEINNKKSNAIFFDDHWWHGNEFGKFFRFSEKFKTMCWDFHDGRDSISTWVEQSAKAVGR